MKKNKASRIEGIFPEYKQECNHMKLLGAEKFLYQLPDYEKRTLAMLVVHYCNVALGYSLPKIADAANVDIVTINRWIHGDKADSNNLAEMILNLDILSSIEYLIKPNIETDRFSAVAVRKYAGLHADWIDLQKDLDKVKLDRGDLGKRLLRKKYFQLFGKQMIDAALKGMPSVHLKSIKLPIESGQTLNSMEDIKDDSYQEFDLDDSIISNLSFLRELQDDGFCVEIESCNRLIMVESYPVTIDPDTDDFNCDLFIDWAVDEPNDGFSWFLNWLHVPGLSFIEEVFELISQETIKRSTKLELPFYSVFKYSNYEYEDEESKKEIEKLYYEDIEIPVNIAYLREFFFLKGFSFQFEQNAKGPKQHVAKLDWSKA